MRLSAHALYTSGAERTRWLLPVMRDTRFSTADLAQFGARLAARRQALRLSRRACAARAGISRTTLMYLERGTQQPSARTLARLAAALDLPVAQLVSPAPSREPDTSALDRAIARLVTRCQAIGLAGVEQLLHWAAHIERVQQTALKNHPPPKARQAR